jgi:hypothetical protein
MCDSPAQHTSLYFQKICKIIAINIDNCRGGCCLQPTLPVLLCDEHHRSTRVRPEARFTISDGFTLDPKPMVLDRVTNNVVIEL